MARVEILAIRVDQRSGSRSEFLQDRKRRRLRDAGHAGIVYASLAGSWGRPTLRDPPLDTPNFIPTLSVGIEDTSRRSSSSRLKSHFVNVVQVGPDGVRPACSHFRLVI